MSLSESAPAVRAEADAMAFTFDDRHWRVRGFEKQLSCERMKVNLMVARRELSHIDTAVGRADFGRLRCLRAGGDVRSGASGRRFVTGWTEEGCGDKCLRSLGQDHGFMHGQL